MKRLLLLTTLIIVGCATNESGISEPEKYWWNIEEIKQINIKEDADKYSIKEGRDIAECEVQMYKIPMTRSCVIENCDYGGQFPSGACMGRNAVCRRDGLNEAIYARDETMKSCMASKGYMLLTADEFKEFYPLLEEKRQEIKEKLINEKIYTSTF